MLKHFFCLLLLTTTCLVSAAQSIDTNLEYSGSGILQFQMQTQGKITYAVSNTFEFQVCGPAVRIRTSGFLPPSNGLRATNHEFITDGKTSLIIQNIDVDPKIVEKSQVPGGSSKFSAFVEVYDGPFPPSIIGNIGPIWLALASSAVLHRQGLTEGLIHTEVAVCPTWPKVESEMLKASWEFYDKPPHLPQYLVENASGKTFSAVDHDYTTIFKKPLPRVYADGYTNAIYSSLEWTNADQIYIPKHFKYVGFWPNPQGNSKEALEVRDTYEGYLDSVQQIYSNTIVLPQDFPRWTRITDYRIRGVSQKPVVYTSESGKILTKKELVDEGAGYDVVNLTVAHHNGQKTAQQKHRVFFIYSFFALLLVPLSLLLWQLWKNKKTNAK